MSAGPAVATTTAVGQGLRAVCKEIRVARRELVTRNFAHFVKVYLATVVPFALLLVVAGLWRSIWTIVACAIVAGFTQNALGILTHESSHYFVHHNRRVNDAIADVLVSLPIYNSVAGYRAEHLIHHRISGAEDDPYYGLYGPYQHRSQVRLGFLRDLTGATAARTFLIRYTQRENEQRDLGFFVELCLVQGAIGVGLWAVTGRWWAYFASWLLPLLTIPIAINRLRIFVEHHAGPDPSGEEANRSTRPRWFEYFTIAPYGYANHFIHHLLPDIPYYQLEWAHHRLAEGGFEFNDQQVSEGGYLRAFRRLYLQLD